MHPYGTPQKGKKKSPWFGKLLQMGQNFSRLHTINYVFSVARPTKKSQVAKE